MKTAIDLFCGGGGASMGLKAAGYHVILAVDNDESVLELHSANFPKTKHYNGDITALDFSGLGCVDHVHASPPCQAFSDMTKSTSLANHESSRGLWRDVARCVSQTKPQTITVENVPKYAQSIEFSSLVASLRRDGYVLFWDTLNASWFGVPQSRERLILFGVRDEISDRLNVDGVSRDLFGNVSLIKTFNKAPTPSPYSAIADLIPTFEDHPLKGWQRAKLIAAGIDPDNAPVCFLRNAQGRLGTRSIYHPPNIPIPTITKLHWHHWDLSLGNGIYKVVPVAGLARLQGFPDWYQFPLQKFRSAWVIGNSVPPPLLAGVLNQFLKKLDT